MCINDSNGWTRIGAPEAHSLNPSVLSDLSLINELKTESGWSEANYKVTTGASRIGYWYSDGLDNYLYKCIDDNNGWTRIGTPPTVYMEITSTSHPILTASLTAHNWDTGFYTQGGSDEPAGQGQKWWDEANNRVYERNMNGKWAKTFG